MFLGNASENCYMVVMEGPNGNGFGVALPCY